MCLKPKERRFCFKDGTAFHPCPAWDERRRYGGARAAVGFADRKRELFGGAWTP